MGTHPIFESDFDCLTGRTLSLDVQDLEIGLQAMIFRKTSAIPTRPVKIESKQNSFLRPPYKRAMTYVDLDQVFVKQKQNVKEKRASLPDNKIDYIAIDHSKSSSLANLEKEGAKFLLI